MYIKSAPATIAIAMIKIENGFAANWISPLVNVGNIWGLTDNIHSLTYK